MLKNVGSGHKSPTGAAISAHLLSCRERSEPKRRERLRARHVWARQGATVRLARRALDIRKDRSPSFDPLVQRACLWTGSRHRRQVHAEDRAPRLASWSEPGLETSTFLQSLSLGASISGSTALASPILPRASAADHLAHVYSSLRTSMRGSSSGQSCRIRRSPPPSDEQIRGRNERGDDLP